MCLILSYIQLYNKVSSADFWKFSAILTLAQTIQLMFKNIKQFLYYEMVFWTELYQT